MLKYLAVKDGFLPSARTSRLQIAESNPLNNAKSKGSAKIEEPAKIQGAAKIKKPAKITAKIEGPAKLKGPAKIKKSKDLGRTDRPNGSSTGRSMRLPLLIVAAVLVAAAGAGVYRFWPRHVIAHGTDFGVLPGGVDRSRLNLVVVTLDTTRADRLGAYGWQNAGTPTFDSLAKSGVLFEHATTAAPLTLPAHSTIFTGRFPPEHGVRDNGGYFLNASETTLAETLKAHGYATGGFIAAYVLDSKWGINQGFDTYFDDFDLSKYKVLSMGAIQRPGNEVVDHALPWIAQHRGAPFFAWIHLYDAHTPYDPPSPFRERYPEDPYQGEISFADSQVGRLVQSLADQGLLDRTVIVVIGDHGESLGDHGEKSHGFFIYESTTHVPMLIHAPFSAMQHRRIAD